MPRNLRTHARAVVVLTTLIAAAVTLPAASSRDQVTAPPMGTFRDLEIWTRDVGDVPDSELGLGLHLAGSDATLLVTFSGVKLRRDPRAPAREVEVIAKPGAKLNTGRTLNRSLLFVATDKKEQQKTITMTNRVTTYPPGPFVPGDTYVVSLRAGMTPEEFLHISSAETLKANILGVGVAFRPDQLKALKALGDRLGFVAR
jgi:hypothetical protein